MSVKKDVNANDSSKDQKSIHIPLVSDHSTQTEDGFTLRLVKVSEEQEQLSRLLDEGFTQNGHEHYKDDFPLWFDGDPTSQTWGFFNLENELIATASCRIALLKVGARRIKVGIVGGISTAAQYRGKGLAKKLLDRSRHWLQQNRISVAFLWGVQTELYRKSGFHLAGAQKRVHLQDLDLVENPKLIVRHGWTPHLIDIIRRRGQGLVVSERDLRWYTQHKNVHYLWAGTDEKPEAFVAIDRGIDLKGVVHEWGGQPAIVKQLLHHLRSVRADAQIISSATTLQYLNVKLDANVVTEFLAMASILDPEELVREIFPQLRFTARRDEEGLWRVQFSQQLLQKLNDEELHRLLFGPLGKLEDELKPLPIPIWFWGLDGA